MTILELRNELGLTLSAFAEKLGLSSKGHASEIEKENRCALGVALEIERLSGGRINAADLNADVRRARAAMPNETVA